MILRSLLTLTGVGILVGSSVVTPPDTARVAPSVERLLRETGAPVKVWVEFSDKGFADDRARAAALDELAAGYPSRAVERRARRRTFDGLFDVRDLPLADTYVEAVRTAGADVCVRARWLNAVSARVDERTLSEVRRLPFVCSIDLVRKGELLTTSPRPAAVEPGSTFYGAAQTQLDMIELPALHSQGFTGQGVVIGVLGTGFLLTHDAFTQPGHPIQVVAAWDFVDNDPEVGPETGDPSNQHEHGTLVLGTLAAYLPNVLVGAAYDASYVLAKVEDTAGETQVEEDYYVAGLQFVEQNGADVATSSLGYSAWYSQSDLDGVTAKSTLAVNVATGNGVFCCTAAGNGGNDQDPATSSLIAPADAFDVLTCGAVESTMEVSGISSDGPTADGRVKPELMTQGESVFTVSAFDDTSITSASGTSMATPLLAGAVACLVQAGPSYDVATMRERLIRSASYLGSPLPDPFFVYGFGIPDVAQAFALAGSWSDLGGGVAGTAGTPVLTGSGALIGTEATTLDLASARPSALVVLIVGATRLDLPIAGGILVPSPIFSLPLATDASGALSVPFSWAAGLPSGLSLYWQVWLADPLATFGLAASNALRSTTP